MPAKPQRPKPLRRVFVNAHYIVHDSPSMIEEAKTALYEDLMNAVKQDELQNYLDDEEAPDADESDIPDWLLGEPDEDDEK